MSRLVISSALVLATGVGFVFGQQRMKEKGPKDFKTVYAELGSAWEQGSFRSCLGHAKELTGIVTSKREEVIRAALPAAPPDYEVIAQKKQNNAMMAALAASVGNVIEHVYQSGNKRIQVTVTADSPMVQMFGMMLDNPALLGDKGELIQYEENKAILKHEGRAWTLQMKILDSMLEARFTDEDDEFALRMFDQAAVTRLTSAISM